jgi:large subunit ribosomal protein L5
MSFSSDYKSSISAELGKNLGKTNPMSIPRLEKIVVNVGMGSWLQGAKDYSKIVEGIEALTGQKVVVKESRFSVSNFKLRKGMPVGVMVTLRGEKMYSFLERMVTIVSPRIRDFSGFSRKSFDGRGNYSFGVDTYGIFPEIQYKEVVKNYGIQFTVVTSASSNEDAKALLDAFGFPFKKES